MDTSVKMEDAMKQVMHETKPFSASQTIWSAIAVIGSSAAGAFLAWRSGDFAAFGAAVTAVLGGLNAVVGRVRAVTPIG